MKGVVFNLLENWLFETTAKGPGTLRLTVRG
jgi:hypothetical protein